MMNFAETTITPTMKHRENECQFIFAFPLV